MKEKPLILSFKPKIQSVIVEGGRKVLDAFIASGLYEEVRILRSPLRLAPGLPVPSVPDAPRVYVSPA